MTANTWTPMLVVLPERIAEKLKAVTCDVFCSASDEDRLNVENFCASVGWSSDALAIGAWLALVIDERLEQTP